MDAICVEKKQTLSPLICVFVCRARIAANIPSKRQQASKTPAHRTRLNQKMWTQKLYDGMVISHPPFRTLLPSDFHSKELKSPKLCYVMYSPCERKRVKIWNKAKPNGEFQNGDDGEEISRPSFCLAALHLCASVIAHLFCRLPASSSASNHFNFQHPPSTIVKLPQNSYVRIQKERRTRMNVGTSSSIPHRTRWQLRWGSVARCKHRLLCTGHIPVIFLLSFLQFCFESAVLKI